MYKQYLKNIKYIESLDKLTNRNYMKYRTNPIFYIQRIKYFLNLINNPQNDFKFIHVTGTSGKGSTCEFIHSILTEAKIKTGLFTSPHIVTTTERIKTANKYIAPKQFVDLLNYLKPYIQKAKNSTYGVPSYFEIILALSFLHFQKQKCKYVILEVGCGGQYDATNVIKKSEISIITNINLDHTQVLGNTLEAIAKDKSEIIKSNICFLTTENRLKILKIFKSKCKASHTKFFNIPNIEKMKYTQSGTYFKLKNDKQNYFISLLGKYQIYNANLAITTAKQLKIPTKHILNGLRKTKLPCRFEIISKNPLTILDGAHNEFKIKSVIDNLSHIKYNKIILVIGIKESKNSKKILNKITPYANQIFITSIYAQGQEKKHLQKLKKITFVANSKVKIKILQNPLVALEQALKKIKKNDLLLITGSFYLTGELRKKWYSENYVLKNCKSMR